MFAAGGCLDMKTCVIEVGTDRQIDQFNCCLMVSMWNNLLARRLSTVSQQGC